MIGRLYLKFYPKTIGEEGILGEGWPHRFHLPFPILLTVSWLTCRKDAMSFKAWPSAMAS